MLDPAASMLLDCCRLFKSGGVIINEHTLTPAGIRRHLETLARHFEFIHPDELPLKLKQPSKRPFCLLTFDDGKRSNATQAAPELSRMGIPAIFFITTGFIGQAEPLWFDRYDALLKTVGEAPRGLERKTLKRLPFKMLAERLDRFCVRHGVVTDAGSEDIKAMSWDEIRHLRKLGFVIGSHGVRHAILTRESREAAFSEIRESMSRITSETGCPCRSFAFPNGNHTAELAQYAMKCGADLVATTEPAWVTGQDRVWRLPRIQLHESYSTGKILMKIALSAMEGILANPDGTGRAYASCRRMARRSNS
jgi:peptidoglycan/xylan/chitin deacetylase (PgdA/CDA1 family)